MLEITVVPSNGPTTKTGSEEAGEKTFSHVIDPQVPPGVPDGDHPSHLNIPFLIVRFVVLENTETCSKGDGGVPA